MATLSKQTLDQNLFFLGGIITLILTVSAILNLANPNSLLTLLLFLPVPLYFLYLSYFKIHDFLKKFFNIDQVPQHFFGQFSIREFVSQSDWDFLVTLIIFSLVFAVSLFKISQSILP